MKKSDFLTAAILTLPLFVIGCGSDKEAEETIARPEFACFLDAANVILVPGTASSFSRSSRAGYVKGVEAKARTLFPNGLEDKGSRATVQVSNNFSPKGDKGGRLTFVEIPLGGVLGDKLIIQIMQEAYGKNDETISTSITPYQNNQTWEREAAYRIGRNGKDGIQKKASDKSPLKEEDPSLMPRDLASVFGKAKACADQFPLNFH